MSPIEPATRRRAELFGTILGLIGGVFSAKIETSSMVLSTIGASLLAGVFGNLFAGAGDDCGVRPRAGIRAGLIAAMVSGATAVAVATITSGAFAMLKITPALLAIPPGAFFGLLGSLVVSMIQNPTVRPIGQWEPKQKSKPSALFVVVLLLSILGYSSPFIAMAVPSKPVVVRFEPPPLPKLPTPSPTPEPRPVVPPPPPWRYSAPKNFEDARPSQLRLHREVSLGRFDSPLRLTFLDDNRRIAFVRPDSSIVSVDLNEPETRAVFPLPESPERYAFSRDFKKVFCAGNRGGIFVTSTDGAVRLPLPNALPAGTISWDSDGYVFVGAQRLDLETLRLLPNQEITPNPVGQHPNIGLRPNGRIVSAEELTVRADRQTFFRDEKRDYAVVANLGSDIGKLSADGTKLFFVRDGELFVRYFEVGQSRETKFNVTMPDAPASAIAEALNARALVVMLCAPIINPLNRKTVAADLSRVKALIGIESWTDTIATMWLKEDYGELPSSSDVVAFMGKIENGRIVPLPEFAEWWSPITDVKPGDAPERIAPITPKEAPPPTIPVRDNPPPKPKEYPLPAPLANQLKAFIREHHAKSSRYDIDGVVADYAERVDHLNGAVVSRDKIREEEIKSHRPGMLSEVVQSDIRLIRISDTEVRANYTMRFDQRLQNGNWANGFSELDLTIDFSGSAPRITRQRSRNYDVKKGP